MTKKITGSISVCIFLLYSAAVLFFMLNVLFQTRTGSMTAQQHFAFLKTAAENNALDRSFMSPEYVESLKKIITDNNNLVTAVIHTRDGVQFAYPLHKPFIGLNSLGEPEIKSVSPLIKIFSASFSGSENEPAIITAAVYTILPQTLVYYGKITFLVVLAGTIIALLTALLAQVGVFDAQKSVLSDALKTEKPLPTAVPEQKNLTEEIVQPLPECVPETPLITPATKIPETIDLPETLYDIAATDTLFEQEIDSLLNDEVLPEKTAVEEIQISVVETENSAQKPAISIPETEMQMPDTAPIPAESAEENKKKSLDPMGLFSQKTGLGWESYLETRLDAELIRSASSEQNLVLMLITAEGILHENPAAKTIADSLLQCFNFRDLLFEFGNNGYAVILQDSNLDVTMQYAETMFSGIKKVLGEISIQANIRIGMSSRAQRLITGSRLINEAALALKKSFEETDLPIVAFKVNTEKYREYLTEELRSSFTVDNTP